MSDKEKIKQLLFSEDEVNFELGTKLMESQKINFGVDVWQDLLLSGSRSKVEMTLPYVKSKNIDVGLNLNELKVFANSIMIPLSQLFWASQIVLGASVKTPPVDVAKLRQLKAVIYVNQNINLIDSRFFRFKNITRLSLAGNNLSTLPVDLADLKELKVLSLARNNLHAIPDSIRHLKNLTELDLRDNKITSIPDWLKDMKQLGYLGINPITHQGHDLHELLPYCTVDYRSYYRNY